MSSAKSKNASSFQCRGAEPQSNEERKWIVVKRTNMIIFSRRESSTIGCQWYDVAEKKITFKKPKVHYISPHLCVKKNPPGPEFKIIQSIYLLEALFINISSIAHNVIYNPI
jgi:hypothetical protein